MSDLTPETEAIVQQIATAATDLNWPSETDAPFDVLVWPEASAKTPTAKFSGKQVLEQAHLDPETPIEILDLVTFFEPTLPQSWHSAEEQAIARQFQALHSLLNQTLEDIQVFRCGEIEIDIYIVGRSPESDWVVLHTAAVET
jgi:Nuclease A inhibitor-like protein